MIQNNDKEGLGTEKLKLLLKLLPTTEEVMVFDNVIYILDNVDTESIYVYDTFLV